MTFWDKVGKGLAAVGLAEAQEQIEKPIQVTPPPVTGGTVTYSPGVATYPQGAQIAVVQAQTYSQPAPSIDHGRARELDEKARSIIIEALKNDNAPLVEEISDSLDIFAETIPDEAARFKTALKIFAKKGHSVALVLSDFDKCLGALDETQRTFESNMRSALDSQVGAKMRAVEALNSEIAALQASLNEKIARRDQEQAGITVEQTKIEQAQSRFTIVYGNIRQDIEQKRAKIARFGEGL